MAQIPDFRPDLDAAQQWVAGLMEAVRADHLGAPTPCTDFDVQTLLEHQNAIPGKIAAVAGGDNPRDLPFRVEIDADSLAEDFRDRGGAAMSAWDDDDLLTATLTAPWGPAPGGIAVGGFLMETLAHGWDLAVATGQDAEADPALVAKAQAVAEQALTDDSRGSGMPFGSRVEAGDGAGPTERFAAFLGRSRP